MCDRDEASIKILKQWGLVSFQVGELIRMPGNWGIPTSHGKTLLCSGPSRPRPVYLFSWLFIGMLSHSLYNKPVKENIFLSSVSHYKQMIQPEEEIMGITNLWPHWAEVWPSSAVGLWNWLQKGASLVGTFPIAPVLTFSSVTIGWNCMVSSWCPQTSGELLSRMTS